ncbi:MAG: RluA family pseudouridine synthase [Candidatus Hydrogenedentota bacterium]|nr:MAG: RluA family pseudouridine synthase [Candidatus Hydrogenedentota bacterium]
MKPNEYTLKVSIENAGTRLDQYLAAHVSKLSRARVQALIHSGNVLVNGRDAKPSHRVRPGESIWVSVQPVEPPSCKAEDIPLDVVFEDEHIIVVDKPAGMVVHPAATVRSGTLVNALMAHLHHLPTTGGVDRPGIVHRLDKNTSGLLIIAKTEASHRSLTESMSRRAIERQYRALAYGDFAESAGTIDAPIGRSPSDRKKMAVTGVGSREAKTHFTVRERFGGVSHLTVRLSTGRTHQIRVHMAYIGHPIIGDSVYGVRLRRFHEKMAPAAVEAISGLHGHMLHAETLDFDHPASREPMQFNAPLPDEFANLLRLLQKEEG